MGIPIGKLSLYSACAGVHPYYTLPITLDVGTDNGLAPHGPRLYRRPGAARCAAPEYDAFIEEFVCAVKEVFPKALLQWEDFGNTTAFRLLERYRTRLPSFNDDIQGTAAVALAGLIAGLRITGGALRNQRVLFLGAGEAGTGIAGLFVAAAAAEGVSAEDARRQCWFVDSKGLVVKGRGDRSPSTSFPTPTSMRRYRGLAEAVRELKPTVLIGVSAVPSAFTREVVEAMAAVNARPIIFALSNPTSKAECTAEQAYTWSEGRAVFASGSAFPAGRDRGPAHRPRPGEQRLCLPGRRARSAGDRGLRGHRCDVPCRRHDACGPR